MGERTWPHLLTALLRGEELSTATPPGRWARSWPARPRPRRSPRSPSRCGPRARRPPRSPAWSRRCSAAAPGAARPTLGATPPSTSSAPAATAPTPSTSPPWPRSWWPAPGVPVVKHGNRAASSSMRRGRPAGSPRRHRSTSAPTRSPGASSEAGIGFCFAARFHPGLRHAAVPAREMGVPTVFNFLGPLTNPAQPTAGRHRLRRRAHGAGDGRGARRARRLRAAGARRGRAGRVHHHRPDPGLGGHAAARSPRPVLDAADLGLPRVRPGRPARRRRRPYNAAVARRMFWPASPGRSATRCCSTRRPRSPPAAGLSTRRPAGAAAGRHRPRRGRRRLGRRDRPRGPLGRVQAVAPPAHDPRNFPGSSVITTPPSSAGQAGGSNSHPATSITGRLIEVASTAARTTTSRL